MVDNRLIINHLPRAENGTRTRDLNLGKVALYQLSYFRNYCFRTGGKLHPHLGSGLRNLRFGTANINRKIYSAKFSGEFCRKITLAPPENAKKKRRYRCDRAGMPGANAQQRTATKIRLPEMAALSIYGSPSERIPISGP